jgi:hypothetical protein
MAVPANTVQRYDIVGDREDLTDVIYDISPTETPVFTMAKRGKATSTLHEWQTDELEAPDTANAHLDGDDSDSEPYTASVRTGNYTQILKKVFQVSGTTDAIRKAGRKTEIARIANRRMKALKRDIEATILSNNAANAGAAAVARQMAGLGAIIKTNVDKEATGTNPVWVNNLPTDPRNDGVQRAFTETMLKAVQQLCWTKGGSPSILSVGAFNKGAVSAFDGIATKTVEQTKAKPGVIIGSADLYVGEFGNLTVVPNRYQRTRDAWLLDRDYLSFSYLRPFKTEKLAKTGDSDKRHILVEGTLEVGNEQAHGLVADLTDA